MTSGTFFAQIKKNEPFVHACTEDFFDATFEANFEEIYTFYFQLCYEGVYKELYSTIFKETRDLLMDPIKNEVENNDLSKDELKAFYKMAFDKAVDDHLSESMLIAHPFSAGCQHVPELASEAAFHKIIADAIKSILLEIRNGK